MSSQRAFRSSAEQHWLTHVSLTGPDYFWMWPVLSAVKSCRAYSSPAAFSSVWAVVFCLCFLSFSLWLTGAFKKSSGILYLSVSQMLGWMWTSEPRQAAVMLALKVLLLSNGVGFSGSQWVDWQGPWKIQQGQTASPTPGIHKSFSMHTGWPWKRPWRVFRMERTGGLSLWGEAEGPWLVQPGKEDTDSGDMGMSCSRWVQEWCKSRRKKENRLKLKGESFRVGIRLTLFPMKRNRQWNWFTREAA